MDHFYQQKLINEKNHLQRQLFEAERKLKSLTEKVGDYERLVSLLSEETPETHQPGFRGEFDNARYPAVERMLANRDRYRVLGPNERPPTNHPSPRPWNHPGGMRKLRYDVKPPKDASNTIEEGAAERANMKKGVDLQEVNVGAALRQGGIGSALRGIVANVKNRGVLGAFSAGSAMRAVERKAQNRVERGTQMDAEFAAPLRADAKKLQRQADAIHSAYMQTGNEAKIKDVEQERLTDHPSFKPYYDARAKNARKTGALLGQAKELQAQAKPWEKTAGNLIRSGNRAKSRIADIGLARRGMAPNPFPQTQPDSGM